MKKTLALLAFTILHLSRVSSHEMSVSNNPAFRDLIIRNAYQSILKNMLRQVSEQIKEKAAFNQKMDLDSFKPGNVLPNYKTIVTVVRGEAANGEFSTLKEDVRCTFEGYTGQCCLPLGILGIDITYNIFCIGIVVNPSVPDMKLYLRINGETLWYGTIGADESSVKIKIGFGPLAIGVLLYDMHVSSHAVKICLKFTATLFWLDLSEDSGCIEHTFAKDNIATIMNQIQQILKKKPCLQNSSIV